MHFSWPAVCLYLATTLALAYAGLAVARSRHRLGRRLSIAEAALKNLEDPAVILDPAGTVTSLNPAAERLLGAASTPRIGQPMAAALAPWRDVVAQYQGGAVGTGEVSIGRGVHELALKPLLDAHGQRQATLLVLRDITTLKDAEADMRLARDAATAADQAKSSFLANMSHEIRTPMNGVIGFTQLLQDSPLTDDQRGHLELIAESGRSLLTIIDDVLDYSKIEAGELKFERVPVDLAALTMSACATLEPRAAAKHLRLTCTVAPDVPPIISADPGRLRQIVTNLVGNALKFTEKGSIELQLARIAHGSRGRCRLALTVRDTGIGITTEALNRIFRPFAQADTSNARRYGGTGLGLAITKRLCELMDGELQAEPRPEGGTVFTAIFETVFTEDPAAAPPRSPGHLERRKAAPRDILVFEDNLINQRLIRALLSRMGHRVEVASCGSEGLARLQTGGRFDAILMDIEMPGMDGHEVTRAIRRREAGAVQKAYIIALTAHAMKGERDRCLESGMNDYVTKPINLAELDAALDRSPVIGRS